MHYGRASLTLQRRTAVLDSAFLAHPERFTRGRPVVAAPPAEVWINKPATTARAKGALEPAAQ